MNRKTRLMPMMPARMLAARNSAPRVALMELKLSSLRASGSAPYLSVVTRFTCSALVKLPLICPLPSVMAWRMTGAETTLPSSTMAKNSPTWALE
jgi:hypothetical protein